MTSAALIIGLTFLLTFTMIMASSGERRMPFVIKFAYTDLTKFWLRPRPCPRHFGLIWHHWKHLHVSGARFTGGMPLLALSQQHRSIARHASA